MELYFKKIGSGSQNLIILHGLLGSSDNWQSIAKQINPNYSIFLIDQRNHGRSPHTDTMNYTLMAEDIKTFIHQNNLANTSILGHSMGGKVAMQMALNFSNNIQKLIVVDIAPKKYSGGHEPILQAMQDAPIANTTDRKEVEQFLESRIVDASERQFILKNLYRNEDKQLVWKCNLNSIIKHYTELMDFPNTSKQFLGNTYFIKGQLSDYITPNDKQVITSIFPNTIYFSVPNAAHWVHADNPTEFIEIINKIL